MFVIVKTLTGLVFPIPVNDNTEMREIKSTVTSLMNEKTSLKVNEDLVRLIYRGVELKDSDTIHSKGIKEKKKKSGATIHLCRKVFAISVESFRQIENFDKKHALKTGEHFQQLKSGLSLISICLNRACSTETKPFLVTKGFGTFKLSEIILNIHCPMCNNTQTHVEKGALFHMARWQIIAYTNEGEKRSSWMIANNSSYKELRESKSEDWKTATIVVMKLSAEDLDLDICFRPLRTKVVKTEVTALTCVLSITSPQDESTPNERMARAGAKIICVIDESGSMDGERIDKVKESLTTLINMIPQGDHVALVCFKGSATIRCPLTTDRTRLQQVISKLRGSGGTDITAGVTIALEVLDSIPLGESASILLLSDGEDSGAIRSEEIIENYRRRGKVFTLHTLGYGDGHNADMMYNLAKFGKGNYTSVRLPRDIEQAMALFFGAAISKFAHSIKVRFIPSPDIQVKTVYGKSDVNQFAVSDLSFDSSKDIVFKVGLPARSLDTIAPLKADIEYTLACVSGPTAARRSEVTLNLQCVKNLEEDDDDDDSVLEQLDRVKTSMSIGEARRLAAVSSFADAFRLLEQTKCRLLRRPETDQRNGIITPLEMAKEKVRDSSNWSAGGEGILEDIENNLMEQTASINVAFFMNSAQKRIGEQSRYVIRTLPFG